MRDNTEAATLGFMFPSMQPFSTPPTHFLHDRKQRPTSTATKQRGCHCTRACILAQQRGCVSWVRSVFWEIRGKVSLSRCPPLSCLLENLCLWLEDKAHWVVSVSVEKQPPTDRPTVYRQGGSHIRNTLTYREHMNSPAGRQTVLHFARHLLWV